MDMLENKNTQKRRMPAVAKIALVAALAVGCVLSIAAGLPAQVYNLMSGGQLVIEPGSASITFNDDEAAPLTIEDGRLWFTADGEKVDITGKVDENTPYIYERTDPATGNKGYVIVGGTIDDHGWAEIFMTEDGTCAVMGENFSTSIVAIAGENVTWTELTEAQLDMLNEGSGTITSVNHPWLDKAIEQLGLELD
ncbi:MAG: hypothetical protein HDT37_04950 [Clostridiales bacterium]|nr:hypothetical protein [Clostridiales bacterium]